jgi:hypothetical protein
MNEINPGNKSKTACFASKTSFLRTVMSTLEHGRRRAVSLNVKLALAVCAVLPTAACTGFGLVDIERRTASVTPMQSVHLRHAHAPTAVVPSIAEPSSQTIAVDPAQAGTIPKPKPHPVISGQVMHANNSPILRCWQDGRLVVDQAVRALPKTTANVFTIQDRDTGNDIYTFDLKNALCIVS